MRKFVACVIVFVAVMPVFQRQTQGDGIGREAAGKIIIHLFQYTGQIEFRS